jgi:hypothetical protein
MHFPIVCYACTHPILSLDRDCPFCGYYATQACPTCSAPQSRLPSAIETGGYTYVCSPCAYTAITKK